MPTEDEAEYEFADIFEETGAKPFGGEFSFDYKKLLTSYDSLEDSWRKVLVIDLYLRNRDALLALDDAARTIEELAGDGASQADITASARHVLLLRNMIEMLETKNGDAMSWIAGRVCGLDDECLEEEDDGR